MSSPEEIVEELLRLKGWNELYEVQQKALDMGLLESSSNLVVIAPTASGKTGIAEMAMLKRLKEGGRILYLVPTVSLINDNKSKYTAYN